MKILITGGLGFIGSNIAKRCVEEGHDVTIIDNEDPFSGGNFYNIKAFQSNLKFIKADITDYESIKNYVISTEIVVNCAAKTSHSMSMINPLDNHDSNSIGVINILEIIRRENRDVKLIQLGTTTQLGSMQYQPADELHPEFPQDIYSANKMVSEKYCMIYSKAFGLKTVILRLANVYGPRAAIHSSQFTFNNYFIGLALQNKPITIYKPGNQLRNIMYISDVVNAIYKTFSFDNIYGETFLAVGNDHYSVKEIAKEISDTVGGSLKLVDWPKDMQKIEFGSTLMTNKKIKKVLGWEQKVTFLDGLNLTKKYYNSCLKEYLKF